jgi:hypothetical protein
VFSTTTHHKNDSQHREWTNTPKIWKLPKNSLSQNRYRQHAAKWGPINIWRQDYRIHSSCQHGARDLCNPVQHNNLYTTLYFYTILHHLPLHVSTHFRDINRPVYKRSKLTTIYIITYCSGSIFSRFLSVLVTHAISGCVTYSITICVGWLQNTIEVVDNKSDNVRITQQCGALA